MIKKTMRFPFLFLLFFCICLPVKAKEKPAVHEKSPFEVTGLPLPRFASLGSERVFMRSGPGKQYPATWEYRRQGLPVEIIMEFELWRKIRDSEGAEGWVHKSLLSGKRLGIVQNTGSLSLLRNASHDSAVMAKIEPNAIVKLEECEGLWCHVSASGYAGWLERKYIWGVYPSEELN